MLCTYRCNVCALNIRTTHFITLIYDEWMLACVCMRLCAYVHTFKLLQRTVFHFHLAFVARMLRCTASVMLWSQSSKIPPYCCGLGVSFIFHQVDSKFDSWLLWKGENYHRGRVFEQMPCAFVHLCASVYHSGSLMLLHVCVHITWSRDLFSYESSIHYNQIKTTIVVHLRFSLCTNGAFRFPALNPTKTTEIRHFDCYISKTYF